MSFFKKGQRYEELIEYVYRHLSMFEGPDIEVKRNVKIKGKSGVEHQIDVYYEFNVNNITHRVIIECKNHKKRIGKDKIQSFKAVIDDLGNCTGIFASRNGFQSGAKEFAEFSDIELVAGGEFPMLGKVIAMRIGIMLPDEKVKGEPFWTVMEERDGKVTGTYMTVRENTVGLFLSRNSALEVSKYTGGVVRGVCQRHLRIMCDFSDKLGMKLLVSHFEGNQLLEIPTEDIRKYYFYEL